MTFSSISSEADCIVPNAMAWFHVIGLGQADPPFSSADRLSLISARAATPTPKALLRKLIKRAWRVLSVVF